MDAKKTAARLDAPLDAPLDVPRMPLGLVIGAFLSAAWAALTALVLPLAAFGALPLSLGGAPVPAREWMRVAAPLVAFAGLDLAAFAAGVAARHAWTRPLLPLLGAVVAFYGLGAGMVGAVPTALAVRASIEGVIVACVTLWYFYRKRTVVAYYRGLRARTAHPPA